MYLDDYTGKYHAHHRDYSPIHARLLSEDPTGYADGMNLYAAYMGVNGRDLSGLSSEEAYWTIFKTISKIWWSQNSPKAQMQKKSAAVEAWVDKKIVDANQEEYSPITINLTIN